jgi:hypothetical protein
MNNVLHELFSEKISDEAAYHIVNFLYNITWAIESFYVGEIMRYKKSIIESSNRSDAMFDTEPPF